MRIIVKPVITEKMSESSEKMGNYAFVVNPKANKLEIRKAVEEMYGVTVTAVNTMNYAGKSKSRFTKTGVQNGKTAAYKKAIIKIVEGDTIDFYSNI